MAGAPELYKEYFLQYASYVIRDRAIPDVVDGLKPVHRRIIHTLLTMDDGKFHKVANVVGEAMKYHPHGDSSIYGALVTLANYDLFVERQGNYGNILTGEPAAAARYIECRLLPLAKEVLYNPEITTYVPSYDGRGKEPVVFPAKIPIVLLQGTEGIAVGMSTMILPHNPIEVMDAVKASIEGVPFALYPDLPTGGIMDVSDYQDGKGKVVIRAKLNTSDPKKVIIEELPYTVTSEMMIESITRASKHEKLKISSVTDYTTDHANIEIDLPRGATVTKDFVNALYAYTACETKISVNPLVIKDELPVQMSITQIVDFHASHLMEVLRQEQELRKKHLFDDLHARTLDRIFIEERIYKRIETKKTAEEVEKAVVLGFKPFKDQLLRPLVHDDVERLLKIPIRRISLFDINQNHKQIETIQEQIRDAEYKLAHLKEYSLGYVDDLKKMITEQKEKRGGVARRTTINSFEMVDVKQVAQRSRSLNYDPDNGYLGWEVKDGETLFKVSEFDRILVIRKDGSYMVEDAPGKEFVGKKMLYCALADKEELAKTTFTVLYQEKTYKHLFLKRLQIASWQLSKPYQILPDGNFKILKLSTLENAEIKVEYKPKPGMRIKEEKFYFSNYPVHGLKARGYRLAVKEIASLRLRAVKEIVSPGTPSLFEEEEGEGDA